MVVFDEIYVVDMGCFDLLEVFLCIILDYNFNDFFCDSFFFCVVEMQYENGNYQWVVESYINYLNQFLNGINVFMVYYYKVESYVVLCQYDQVFGYYDWVVVKGFSCYYVWVFEKVVIIVYNYVQDFNKFYDLYICLE